MNDAEDTPQDWRGNEENGLALLARIPLADVGAYEPSLAVDNGKEARAAADDVHGGLVALRFATPANWRVESHLTWRYQDCSYPVRLRARATAPDGSAWVEAFETEAFYWLDPADPTTPPGARNLGMIHLPPRKAVDALIQFVIEPSRSGRAGLEVVGIRPLANLPEALGQDPMPGEGVAVRVRYRLDGRPVDEEFYTQRTLARVPYRGPMGTTMQTNWRLELTHSLGAIGGTLEQRRPLLGRIAASFKADPIWLQYAQGVMRQIQAEFNRMIAQGYAQIEAAGQLSRVIGANNDAVLSLVEAQRRASNRAIDAMSSRAASGARSNSFSEYIRGVETMKDSYWGTSEQSSNYSYHWTDGAGSYRHSNDPGYNPNIGSNQTWQRMERAP